MTFRYILTYRAYEIYQNCERNFQRRIQGCWKPLTIITKRSILDVAAALDPPLHWNLCFKQQLQLRFDQRILAYIVMLGFSFGRGIHIISSLILHKSWYEKKKLINLFGKDQTLGAAQLLPYHKVNKIWTPPPPLLALVKFQFYLLPGKGGSKSFGKFLLL